MISQKKFLILTHPNLKIGMMNLMVNGKLLESLTLNIRENGDLNKSKILNTKEIGFILKLIILNMLLTLNYTLMTTLELSVLRFGKLNQELFLITFW